MVANIVNWGIAIVTLGSLGWVIGWRRAKPTGPFVYVLLLAVAIIGLFIGKNLMLVGVDEFGLYLNRAIFSCCIGGGIGLAGHSYKLSRQKNM